MGSNAFTRMGDCSPARGSTRWKTAGLNLPPFRRVGGRVLLEPLHLGTGLLFAGVHHHDMGEPMLLGFGRESPTVG